MLQVSGPESGQPDGDKPREACGIIGVYLPNEEAARNAFFGLFALQHRGQESAGISSSDGQRLHTRTKMGLVNQVFREEDLSALPGLDGDRAYSLLDDGFERTVQRPTPIG